MAGFDLENYFDKRIAAELLSTTESSTGLSKYDELMLASREKQEALEQLAASREINKRSLLGEYSNGGFLDATVATLASPVTQTGNALASALEMHNEANETDPTASEQTKAAAQKIREALNMDSLVGINPETGERTSSLHRRVLGDTAIAAIQGSAAAVQGVVGLGSMVSGGHIGKAANEAGFRPKDGISILDGYLSPEMRKANQRVSAAEGFTGTASEILDNPSTIPHNIAKSIPSMILGGAIGKAVGLLPGIGSGLAGAIGEGTMMAGSQAENIREQTADGRLTLKQALLAAGTGVMGAGVGFAGNKLANALRIGDIDEALVTGALAKSPRGVFARTTLAGGIEGGEELLQSSGEQLAQNLALDKPYDQGVGSASALGLFTGSPMGAMSGLAGGAQDKQEDTPEAKAAFAAAVATNDSSAYLDPESRSYNPTRAVEVHFAAARNKDATPEARQESLTKATDIVAGLEAKYGQAATAYSIAAHPAFDKSAVRTKLEALKAKLATVDVADPANAKMVAGLTEAIQNNEMALAASESKTALKLLKAKADGLAKQLVQTTNVRDELAKLVRGKTSMDEVRDAVIAANATVDINDASAVETAQKAVSKVISLSMVNLGSLSVEAAEGLANNAANSLTEPQRQYLRVFSQARLAENTLKTMSDVSKDIYLGNPGGPGKTRMLGIVDYNKNIGLALEAKDVKAADYQLELLNNFTQGHKEKAELITNTFNKVKVGLLPDSQLHKTDTGWVLVSDAKKFLTTPELEANGGLEIHRQSDELVSNTVKEAEALQQVLTAQQAAYNLTFQGNSTVQPTTTTTVATNATQAPSVGEAVAPGAAVVGGAVQTNTSTNVQKVNTPTEPVQKTGNSVQVTPVAQTTATPSSVAPEVPTVQSAASPLSKNVSVLENAEDKERVSVKSPPLSVVEGDTNYSEIYSTLSILFSESTPEEQQALVDAFTNEQEQSNESAQASQTEDSTTNQDPEGSGYVQDAATGQTSEATGGLESQDSQASEGRQSLEADIALIEKEIARAEKLLRKYKRKNISLWSALKHSLSESDLKDVYGSAWKKFTLLKGKPGVDLSSRVANGDLDAFLPFRLNSQAIQADGSLETDAVQHIKDKLGTQDYLTEETKHEMDKVGLSIQELEQQISLLHITEELNYAESETITDNETVAEKDTPVTGEESSGSVASPAGEETAGTEEGKLSVLVQAKSPEGTPYNLRNLLTEYFTQSAGKDGALSVRPLVSVKNFVSAVLIDKTHKIQDFFADKNLSDTQLNALNFFLNRARNWQKTIQASLPKRFDKQYRLNDMLQFLLPEDVNAVGDIDENIKTAISFAAFSWAAEAATSSQFLKDKEINAILNRTKKARVSNTAYVVLGSVGTYQHNLVDSLGGRVLESLGLKAIPDAPQDLVAKLRASLGMRAVKLLEDTKLITRSTLSQETMQQLYEEGLSETAVYKLRKKMGNISSRATHTFFAVARDDEGKPVAAVQSIHEANKGTQGILGKLFQVEVGASIPSLEPITTLQGTTSTGMGVPKELEEAVLANQSNARVVRKDTMALFEEFSEDALHTMMGVVEEEDETTHISNRISVKAKNDGLKREYALFVEYVGEYLATSKNGLDTEFFLEFDVWKQQRIGISTTAVNPQTSKIVRFLIGSPKWTATIDPANEKQMTSFYLRVAEGLGMKTERKDNILSVSEVQTKLLDPTYVVAIQALGKKLVRKEALTAEEQQSIVDAVVKGGGNLHSLDGLIGMAYQQEANGEPFTVQMMGEVDGVANGTMLNHILLGAANSVEELQQILHMGGFYETGSEFTQYNQWRGTAGNLDIYEKVSRKIHEKISEFMNQAVTEEDLQHVRQFASIWAIAGNIFDEATGTVSKDGRNLAKDAMNPLAFGSSLESVVTGMAGNFLGNVIKGFERLATQPTIATQEEIDTYVGHINKLLGVGVRPLPVGRPLSWYMNTRLSPSVESRLHSVFTQTVGEVVTDVLSTEFSTFLARRDALNRAAQATFSISDAIYRGMREAYIEELLAKGDMPVDANGKRLGDLTQKQEAELAKRMRSVTPIVQTATSKNDKGSSTGLLMSKSTRKQNKDGTYTNVASFGTTLGNGAKSVALHGQSTHSESPGVAMGSATTHSTDSAALHRVKQDILQIHDAAGAGVDGLGGVAAELNQRLLETLLNYSPLEEIHNSVARVVRGMARMLDQGTLSPQAIRYVQEELTKQARYLDVKPYQVLSTLLNNTKLEAYQANKIKLGFMTTLGAIDQYAYQGGNYEVTDRNRTDASQLLAAQSAFLSDKDVAALDFLANFMTYRPAPKKATETGVADSVIVEADSSVQDDSDLDEELDTVDPVAPAPVTAPKMSDWGVIGEPAVESDPALVALFANNKVLTGKAVIGSLLKQLGQSDSAFDKAMVLILKQIQSIIPNTMMVTYVTSDTQFDREIHANPSNSRGWYVPQGKGQGIYLLGNEFAASNLQVETVIHELLHAVLLHAIENAVKGSNAAKLVAELETLLAKVTAEVKDTKFKDAITDVHELISWGLTNREFQTDVLMKIKMETKTKGNPLITGMAKLFNSITDFLFDGLGLNRKQVAINGLSILTANVSGLFQEAATNQGPVQVEAKSQVNLLNTHTTEDLYDALDTGEVSSEFGEFHKQILSKIVNKVFGPYGSFRDAIMKNTPQGALQVFTESLISGVAPFASTLLGSGIKINNQEAFVIEQVEATVAYGLSMGGKDSRTSVVRNELLKLYRDTAERLKPTDRNDGSPESELYNTVFNAKEEDFLAKFAAMGMGHEQFNSLLKVATKKSVKILADNSPIGILTRLFSTILEAINGKLTLTFGGQQADQKLAGLVQTLVLLEQKREIVKNSVAPDWQVFLDEKARDTRKGAKSTLNTLINSSMFKKNKNVFIKAGSNLVDVVTAPGRIKVFSANLGKIRDNHFTGLPGVVSGVFNDIKGHKPTIELLLRSVKHHEGLRKQAIELTNGAVLESFADGDKISNDSKGALTKVALRTGAHVLLDQFTPAQLENLVKDPAALQTEIDLLEAKLRKDYKAVYSSYFLDNARALAYQLATGRAVIAHLLRNAHNIASMFGSPYSGQLTEAQVTAATKDLDVLVSMYGMKYSKPTDLALFADLLATENARTDGGNGVQMALLQHKMLEEQSLERLFDGNPVLMRKGYMPEVYNPHTDLQAANEEQGKILMAQGYVQGAFVSQDPDEKDAEPLRLYTLRDGGLLPWQSGITSMTNLRSAGTKHHGDRAVGTQKSMMAAKQGAINKLHRSGGTLDPTKIKESYTVPLLNDKGVAVNYVHLMEERTKDELLERDSRFDTVLGVLAGSIFDKENSPKNNRKAVQLLRDEYDLGFEKDSVAFLEVSDTSTYPELREIYRMMPDSMKESIREIWGEDAMKVRADTLDIMFGYRELSLSTMFDKAADERNHLEQAMVWTITTLLRQHAKRKLNMTNAEAEIYSQRGAVVVRRAENVWHALVKLTKDIFVVKSGITMLGNIMSNKTTLMLYGVPFKDILANSKIAWESAEDYARDNKEMFRLQNQLDTGYIMGSTADLEERVAQLKDSLANNPVSKLIDAGLMPTIVEDMEAQDDDFDYKPGFVMKAEKMLDKLNPTVREVGNQLLMGHSTKMYKTLSRITQMSDFTARYVLYQHLTSLKEDPMTPAEAIQEASEAFVNYDIPLHRKIQYLDKMGFLMFTKYFLRIQRVIRGRLREAPGKVALLMAAQNYFSWLPSIIDSSMLVRFGNNPMNSGALQLFTAGDDLLTMRAALSIVKP